jgi:hypothetical protein
MSKIKVALCLSGEPRSSMFSFPYIYENCINLDPEVFEVDTYSYSFKGFRALPLYNCKKYVIDNRNDEEMFKQWFFPVEEKFNPKCLDLLSNTSNNFVNNQSGIRNLFLMYTNIHNCFNLIEEKYDIYIRARYDLIFQDNIHIENYISKILKSEKDIIIPKEFKFQEDNETCGDQFAIGNYKGMYCYSNLINSLLNLINKKITFRSEILLLDWLNGNNIKFQKSYMSHSLVRNSFVNSYPRVLNFADQ